MLYDLVFFFGGGLSLSHARLLHERAVLVLDNAGVPCGAIRTVGEVCDGPTLAARGMITEMAHPTAGVVKGVKSPIALKETPLDRYVAPPTLGQHTQEIMSGLLGFSALEIEEFRASRTI